MVSGFGRISRHKNPTFSVAQPRGSSLCWPLRAVLTSKQNTTACQCEALVTHIWPDVERLNSVLPSIFRHVYNNLIQAEIIKAWARTAGSLSMKVTKIPCISFPDQMPKPSISLSFLNMVFYSPFRDWHWHHSSVRWQEQAHGGCSPSLCLSVASSSSSSPSVTPLSWAAPAHPVSFSSSEGRKTVTGLKMTSREVTRVATKPKPPTSVSLPTGPLHRLRGAADGRSWSEASDFVVKINKTTCSLSRKGKEQPTPPHIEATLTQTPWDKAKHLPVNKIPTQMRNTSPCVNNLFQSILPTAPKPVNAQRFAGCSFSPERSRGKGDPKCKLFNLNSNAKCKQFFKVCRILLIQNPAEFGLCKTMSWYPWGKSHNRPGSISKYFWGAALPIADCPLPLLPYSPSFTKPNWLHR